MRLDSMNLQGKILDHTRYIQGTDTHEYTRPLILSTSIQTTVTCSKQAISAARVTVFQGWLVAASTLTPALCEITQALESDVQASARLVRPALGMICNSMVRGLRLYATHMRGQGFPTEPLQHFQRLLAAGPTLITSITLLHAITHSLEVYTYLRLRCLLTYVNLRVTYGFYEDLRPIAIRRHKHLNDMWLYVDTCALCK